MKETVIQFGEGNFLRGFFDWFLDTLNKQNLYDGKAVVIQPRAGGKVEMLNVQDCKYNLCLRGIKDGEIVNEHQFIESISRGIDPYKNFEDYIALAYNPDFRFVVSNTTEAGIAFDDSCLLTDKPCKSFPGKLTQLMLERYKRGLDGFIFLPCELIDNNGDELKKCILQYAKLWKLDGGFVDWVNEKNIFANTLVDRIVTGYPSDETASMYPDDKYLDTGEIFHLWVIEGDFEKELPLKKAGFNVVWSKDVKPYKKIKVRILNGAHTSLVTGALLSGVETVGECMENEVTLNYLNACMEEILCAIGDNEETREFANNVFDRFKNPFIKHKLRSIALNSVSKFSVRVLPSIMEYTQKYATEPKKLLFSLSCLIYFYKNDTPDDSQDAIDFIKANDIKTILENKALWGQDISCFADCVAEIYNKISENGVKGAMEWIVLQ